MRDNLRLVEIKSAPFTLPSLTKSIYFACDYLKFLTRPGYEAQWRIYLSNLIRRFSFGDESSKFRGKHLFPWILIRPAFL